MNHSIILLLLEGGAEEENVNKQQISALDTSTVGWARWYHNDNDYGLRQSPTTQHNAGISWTILLLLPPSSKTQTAFCARKSRTTESTQYRAASNTKTKCHQETKKSVVPASGCIRSNESIALVSSRPCLPRCTIFRLLETGKNPTTLAWCLKTIGKNQGAVFCIDEIHNRCSTAYVVRMSNNTWIDSLVAVLAFDWFILAMVFIAVPWSCVYGALRWVRRGCWHIVRRGLHL